MPPASRQGGTSNRTYASDVTAHLAQAPRPGGWRVEYARSDLRNYGQLSQRGQNRETTESERAIAMYQPDPSVTLSASAGYEDDRFYSTREHGATYGGGVEWHPDGRTSINARAEHRFFGTGYSASFDHRTPLTVWSIKAARDLTNYPQQLATLPAGADVSALFNALFASRVPDPVQRQTLVDQFIRERGLPPSLTSALALYTQQFTLAESQTATFGILGARNSILLSAYRSRNEAVDPSASAALSPLLQQFINNTQVGANVVWTHQLAPNLSPRHQWQLVAHDRQFGNWGRYAALHAQRDDLQRAFRAYLVARRAALPGFDFRRRDGLSRIRGLRRPDAPVPLTPGMYEDYYGLAGKPFQLNPDPSFYFGSRGHKRAFAYLEYGLYQSEGFIVITGEIGAGKTTIVRSLLEQLDRDRRWLRRSSSARSSTPTTCCARSPWRSACRSSRWTRRCCSLRSRHSCARSPSTRSVRCWSSTRRRICADRAIEELRMLSNFQLGDQALLQSFLIGQPELREMMQGAQMQQLRQRVIASYHLGPLDHAETQAYIEHRLAHVGWKGDPRFEEDGFDLIHADRRHSPAHQHAV